MVITEIEAQQVAATRTPHLDRCGVPAHFLRRVLEPITETLAMASTRLWVLDDNPRPVLMLAGGVGSGKTLAAAWALSQNFEVLRPYRIAKGDLAPQIVWRSGYFVTLEWLVDRSLFQEDDRLARQRALETSLLVLDDVGTERGDGEAALRDLLSTRMAAGRRTILTTNLGRDAFEGRYRARLMSRIRGEGLVVGCGDVDLRVA